jgi:uncharacterized protein with von Willebrand factor type A (vWA) domain
MMDLVQALAHIEIGRRDDFYSAVSALLVHDHDDLPLFDRAFEMFWRKPVEEWAAFPFGGPQFRERRRRPVEVLPPLGPDNGEPDRADDSEKGEDRRVLEITRTYSDREMLRRKDFAYMTGEELEAVKQLMRRLDLDLGDRRTRRMRIGLGARLDLRASLRRSLKTDGDILEWMTRTPKRKPRPLVVIADISGSMERYTRLLLHFIYGLVQSPGRRVEAFVFSTRLTRITRQLEYKDVDEALSEVSDAVHDWAGGTRTGESLKDFNYHWGRRVLGRGAVVLIISDGWDRGRPELLTKEMDRLHRSCHRLVWLNPLLGSPVYEPLTQGIRAALPHVDDFLPVHNLASLEQLGKLLGEAAGA